MNEIAEYKGYYFLGVDWSHYSEIEKLAKGIDPRRLIVITHDPPYDILDMSYFGSNAGMPELREVVEKIKPAMHVFGHIHESAGVVSTGERFRERGAARIQESGDSRAAQPEGCRFRRLRRFFSFFPFCLKT